MQDMTGNAAKIWGSHVIDLDSLITTMDYITKVVLIYAFAIIKRVELPNEPGRLPITHLLSASLHNMKWGSFVNSKGT